MNSPARTSPYKPPTFDYLGLSPRIQKPKWRDASSGSDSSTDACTSFTPFGTVGMRPIEEPDLEDLEESLLYEFQVSGRASGTCAGDVVCSPGGCAGRPGGLGEDRGRRLGARAGLWQEDAGCANTRGTDAQI